MDLFLSFQEITDMNIKCSYLINSILELMRIKNIKCYVFGDYVCDSIAIEYANKNIQSDRLKDIICKKFTYKKTYNIGLSWSKQSREDYRILIESIYDIIRKYQDQYESCFSEKRIRSKKDVDRYCKEILVFKYANLHIELDIYNDFVFEYNDFWINTLAFNNKGQLTFKPGIYSFLDDNSMQMVKMSEILQDLLNGKAEVHNDLIKRLSADKNTKLSKNSLIGEYFDSEDTNQDKESIKDILVFKNPTSEYEYFEAIKRIETMKCYGYKIPNLLYYRVCVGATKCCEIPNTVSVPFHCSGEEFVAVCLECLNVHIKKQTQKLYSLQQSNVLTDCQITFI